MGRDCRAVRRALVCVVSAAKFTPGPWTAHPHDGRAFFIHAAHVLAPRVATVSYTDGAHSYHEANARLIAAAPDGYNIAERLVAHLRDDFRIPDSADEGWIVDSLGHALGGIYIDALAYLAKAVQP